MTVDISNWEAVSDFEITDQLSPKSYKKRLSFAIAGSIEEVDKRKLDVIVALLRKLGGDAEIEILDIDEGSIKLILGGSPGALERIESLFKSGALTEIAKISVQDVHALIQGKLVGLLQKNGGASVNLSEAKLSGANLCEADLSGAKLNGANLCEADLSGANLSEANLIVANLREADLSGADLSEAYLIVANLRKANLRKANLTGANLIGADLSGAYLSGANLNGAKLSGAYLSEAYLGGADLSGAYLSGANLSRAYLSGADLIGANLIGAGLSRANLSEANLSGVDLSEANLSRAYLVGANLSRADLIGANLSRAVFGNNLGLSKLDKANMQARGAIFQDSPDSDVPSLVRR